MSRAFIGIDPGAGGALALLCLRNVGIVPVVDVATIDMPMHEINGKRRIDLYKLAAVLGAWRSVYDIQRVTVENVNAMPKQGVSSSFFFGFAAGAVQSAVASAGLPMVLVVPQVWKKLYGLRGGPENKDMSRQKASMLFPAHSQQWARKKDDGRAEAVLLAHYGSKLA